MNETPVTGGFYCPPGVSFVVYRFRSVSVSHTLRDVANPSTGDHLDVDVDDDGT